MKLRGADAGDDIAQGGVEGIFGWQGRQGATEIVGNREDISGESLDPEFAFLVDILLGATSDVLRLGNGTQMLVLQLRILGFELLDLTLETAGLLAHFEVFGVLDRHLIRGVARGCIAGHTVSLVQVVSFGAFT